MVLPGLFNLQVLPSTFSLRLGLNICLMAATQIMRLFTNNTTTGILNNANVRIVFCFLLCMWLGYIYYECKDSIVCDLCGFCFVFDIDNILLSYQSLTLYVK